MSSRTLHFPPGPTTATLRIVGRHLVPPRQTPDAEGTVEVPEGAYVFLEVNAEDLGVLSRLKPGDLQHLSVVNPAPGLAAALRAAGISGVGLRGECGPEVLSELAGLEQLTSLEVHRSVLDADCAEALADMRHLESLSIDGGATEAVAAAACRLTGLTRLVLTSQTDGFAAGLDALGDLTRLETLILSAPDLEDTLLSSIAALRELRTLYLQGPGIRGAGIEVLSDLPHLADLHIESPAFDITTLARLQGSPSLAKLTVIGAAVDDAAAPLVAALSPPLREVAIHADRHDEAPVFSLSTQVWLARSRPELSLNGGGFSARALERYVAAGLGGHPVTGAMELSR
jgi:hypothetical protein